MRNMNNSSEGEAGLDNDSINPAPSTDVHFPIPPNLELLDHVRL